MMSPLSPVRRTFSNDRGSGTFHSLGALPKRKHDGNQPLKSHVFYFRQDDDDDSCSLDIRPPPSTSNAPLLPSTAGSRSPFLPPRSSQSIPRPNTAPPRLPIEVESPILLSNGTPLKSSLKSSRSMSLPPQRHYNHQHSRANSEPSSPVSPRKAVHFPEKDEGLATVRIYNRSACPGALNNSPNGNGDETETDGDEPSLARLSFPPLTSVFNYEVDFTKSSRVPRKFSPHVNLLLESFSLAPSSSPAIAPKPFLTGSVLVRNLAFEKHVSIRFSLDDWQTVSEVSARYIDSLPRLPSQICSLASGSAWDDSALQRGRGWDRFAFTIHLEDYAYPLSSRTLWLACRYRVQSSYLEHGSAQDGQGGEWWDNNEGPNYRVEFKSTITASPSRPRCETISAPLPPSRTQLQPPMTSKEHALGVMVPPSLNSKTIQAHQAEKRSVLTRSGTGKLDLCNYVPPTVHVMLSVSVPSEGPPLGSASLETLQSLNEDNPSPISSTLSTPPVSPTIAPRVIINEQVAVSGFLGHEHREEDEKFRPPRPGYITDWGWSASGKPCAGGLPDKQADISPLPVLPTLPGGKAATSSDSLLDAFVTQWCFAREPSPTHDCGDGGIVG